MSPQSDGPMMEYVLSVALVKPLRGLRRGPAWIGGSPPPGGRGADRDPVRGAGGVVGLPTRGVSRLVGRSGSRAEVMPGDRKMNPSVRSAELRPGNDDGVRTTWRPVRGGGSADVGTRHVSSARTAESGGHNPDGTEKKEKEPAVCVRWATGRRVVLPPLPPRVAGCVPASCRRGRHRRASGSGVGPSRGV